MTLSDRTLVQWEDINPDRDAVATGEYAAYSVPVPPSAHSTPTHLISLHGPDGRTISPHRITIERYRWLHAQHGSHATADDPPFLTALAALLRRYHPKSKANNPQGTPLDLKEHWATPRPISSSLMRALNISAELFASPLNCSMAPGVTFFSPFQEDRVFGAVHNSLAFQWAHRCYANPEYTAKDMRRAMERAIQSADLATSPFLCVLVLPAWTDAAYRNRAIMAHPAVSTLISVPSHRFRFVPADQDLASLPEAYIRQLSPAKWGVDFILVANAGGKALVRSAAPRIRELRTAIARCCPGRGTILTRLPGDGPVSPPLTTAPGRAPARPIPPIPVDTCPMPEPTVWDPDDPPPLDPPDPPPLVLRWDPKAMVYTDGSVRTGADTVGAAVVYQPDDLTIHIDATGFQENNTILRAELVGIHVALGQLDHLAHLHLLTAHGLPQLHTLHPQSSVPTMDHGVPPPQGVVDSHRPHTPTPGCARPIDHHPKGSGPLRGRGK